MVTDAGSIKGALKFQARVRIQAQGGDTVPSAGGISVKGADSAAPIQLAKAEGHITLEDVSFRYKADEPLIEHLLAKTRAALLLIRAE